MISHLSGVVASAGLGNLVIDVNGVGMSVLCPPATSAALKVGEKATVVTSLVVREESLTLYGFSSTEERDMWLLVQTVNGVGPKVALAFVSVLNVGAASRALADGDLATLTKVPGIGKKGAERMVIELKDKVLAFVGAGAAPGSSAGPGAGESWREQVREALVGLGWSAKEADKAVEKVAVQLPADHPGDVAQILRLALQSMVKGP